MSGHSKWSTIKHKKAAEDAKKGKIFTKVARMVMLAVRDGGGDETMNPALRSVLSKARSVNMPKAAVQRAIDRGLGKGSGGMLEEVVYEGYGPGGVGIIVKSVTDSRNRTGAEIKSLMDKSGGSLGGPGSVAYLQNIDPVPKVELEGVDRARLEQLLADLDDNDDVVEVWSNLEGHE